MEIKLEKRPTAFLRPYFDNSTLFFFPYLTDSISIADIVERQANNWTQVVARWNGESNETRTTCCRVESIEVRRLSSVDPAAQIDRQGVFFFYRLVESGKYACVYLGCV